MSKKKCKCKKCKCIEKDYDKMENEMMYLQLMNMRIQTAKEILDLNDDRFNLPGGLKVKLYDIEWVKKNILKIDE